MIRIVSFYSIHWVLIHSDTPCIVGYMESFADVINQWDKIRDFADDVGITPLLARQMRARKSIESKYWASIIAAAERRGYVEVTAEMLTQIAARKRAA